MLEIKCPFCGIRDITEFSYHGEAHIVRPINSHELTDEEWGDYVFFRHNTKGVIAERWSHDHGCRRWFNCLRNTITDQFIVSYLPTEKKPNIDKENNIS